MIQTQLNVPGAVFVGGVSAAIGLRFGLRGLPLIGLAAATAAGGAAWRRGDRNASVREILQDSQAFMLDGIRSTSEVIGPTNTFLVGATAVGLFGWGVIKGFREKPKRRRSGRRVIKKSAPTKKQSPPKNSTKEFEDLVFKSVKNRDVARRAAAQAARKAGKGASLQDLIAASAS